MLLSWGFVRDERFRISIGYSIIFVTDFGDDGRVCVIQGRPCARLCKF